MQTNKSEVRSLPGENRNMVILAVSDVHLGYSDSNAAKFQDFLRYVTKMNNVSHLVLLGDIVDMWRRDVSGLFLENENYDVLPLLTQIEYNNVEIDYVGGNHDYHMGRLNDVDYPFKFYQKNGVTIPEDGVNYVFKHGYDFDLKQSEVLSELLCYNFSDDAGNLRSEIWNVITSRHDVSAIYQELDRLIKDNHFVANTALQNGKSLRQEYLEYLMAPPNERMERDEKCLSSVRPEMGNPFKPEEEKAADSVQEDQVLIFGHTHRPFANDDRRLFNTGSWLKSEPNPYTYVSIEDKKVCLMQFDGDKVTDVTALDPPFKKHYKINA